MYKFLAAAGLALILTSCSGLVPGPSPAPINEPAIVQEACQVAQWALPILQPQVAKLPVRVQQAIAAVEAAIPSCAAGSAGQAVAAAVDTLLAYLTGQGVAPPPAVASHIARMRAPVR